MSLSRLAALSLFLTCVACAGEGSSKRPELPDAGLLCTSCDACEETLPVTSALHVTGPIAYDDKPPVGGPHHACWGSWGVHTEPLAAESWVHNLEHGGIVYLYHCTTECPDELAQLTELANSHQRTILTEYDDLPTRFAAVAWGHRITSDCLDLAAFQRFYDVHYDRGLESIAAGPPTGCGLSPDL